MDSSTSDVEQTKNALQSQDEGISQEKIQNASLEHTASNAVSIVEKLPLWREILFVGIISSAQFTTQAGLGQCLSILHVIGDRFHITNPGDLSWLIASYSLSVGTFVLIAGRFGDLFGYKLMLTIGFSWFSLWSLIAGVAYYSNHVLFNFARTFQGMGPAVMLPNSLAILGSSYHPGLRKDMVFAIFGATAPAGSVIASLFSGIFNLTFWPWSFWCLAIVLAVLAVGTVFFVPDPPVKTTKRPLRQLLSQLDLLGGATGVAGLVLINFSWNQAGVVSWPAEPYVWVTLILGFIFIGAFVFIEYRIAKYPLLPFDALTSDVGFVLACVSCGWGCFGIWIYYMWNFFIELRHATPIQASAWSVPLIFLGGTAAIVTGLLLSRIRAAWVMLIAMLAFCLGTIVLATAPVGQTYWAQTFVCVM